MEHDDIVKTIEADGWIHIKTKGSHRQSKHPLTPGRVTVPGHPGDDVKLDSLKSILNQAGLRGKP